MTYNKNVKKYIKQCKYLFASYGKSEKEYIRKLIDNIDDGSHDMTYDEVVERLGTPKEVIISYYEQEDMDSLIEKAKVRRLLKNFLSVALVVLLVFLCYKAYIVSAKLYSVPKKDDQIIFDLIVLYFKLFFYLFTPWHEPVNLFWMLNDINLRHYI
ncbi:DUF6120 family protein [Catenibacterium sp.]|uniref:DUF6120 family protein n=1 Tax=Catenibacterium sp. TaxID=2049022 RepID=UPI00399205B1